MRNWIDQRDGCWNQSLRVVISTYPYYTILYVPIASKVVGIQARRRNLRVNSESDDSITCSYGGYPLVPSAMPLNASGKHLDQVLTISFQQIKKKRIPIPGIEPGPSGWKPDIVTTRLYGMLLLLVIKYQTRRQDIVEGGRVLTSLLVYPLKSVVIIAIGCPKSGIQLLSWACEGSLPFPIEIR